MRWLVCALLLTCAASAQPTFNISFGEGLIEKPFSGRVYVALTDPAGGEPRLGMSDWFNPAQVLAVDVIVVTRDGVVTIDKDAHAFPKKPGEIEPGRYAVQAVARLSRIDPVPGQGEGDLYSETIEVDLPSEETIDLVLTQTVQRKTFRETERVKLFEMQSDALSNFHEREVTLRAGVILPNGWNEEPDARYPVVYLIGGFGGSHHDAHTFGRMLSRMDDGRDTLIVVPDPTWYRGHTVFADSANNGPWGQALVEELIPGVEAAYRGMQSGEHRYVTGVSSGGWSSLWLQITYPDDFGGCWSHVPDPVDFRDFQRIDLYTSGSNMYTDEDGMRRPLARMGGQTVLWYDDFVAMETVLGPGGQIHAFEAVFSPRGPDGNPLPLFDRATGRVDVEVARAWEPYDIRLVLERNWDRLAPKLAGKIRVYAGEFDTFYLEGATRLLKESVESIDADAHVEIVPGMIHSPHFGAIRDMFETIEERMN